MNYDIIYNYQYIYIFILYINICDMKNNNFIHLYLLYNKTSKYNMESKDFQSTENGKY